ncbi:MAG: DUF4442 domain-containing protein [Candidatus Sericytochromatia bacterium]|nr:DUF4442 domain-containing protein [Candidatus Sericytochromatia bacterium]
MEPEATPIPESLRTRLLRWLFNAFPAYRGTGGRITHIAADFSEVRVRLPLSWRTYNYHGTIFGGSMYGAVDPIHAIMLIHRLGAGHEVWVKAATVRFLKPGRTNLEARFTLDDAEVAAVRALAAEAGALERGYEVALVDAAGVPHGHIAVTLHVRRRPEPQAGRPPAWPARLSGWLLGGGAPGAAPPSAPEPETPRSGAV